MELKENMTGPSWITIEQSTLTPISRLLITIGVLFMELKENMTGPSWITIEQSTLTPISRLLITIGGCLLAQGEYDRAVWDYDKAIELNQSFAIAYYNRAESFILLREWKKAESDFSMAKTLGMDIAAAFHGEFGSIPEFEREYRVQLPLTLADILAQVPKS